ncbi:hypothetical protein [Anaerotignum propionicum]|uniref:hypothetical protein n=1 Tax=Anaerotignum propionicum TaxID=28446 RepID=UPI00289BBEB4|nr:hypothetical protein [Anaerotignum propionicum]
MAETVMRHQIADYLDVSATSTPEWALMGVGFNTLDENPNAQVDSKTYVNEKSQTSHIKSYQVQFPFDTDLISSEDAITALYEIGRDQKTGADAELEYVRVELFSPVTGEGVTNTFRARKFKVAVAVTGNTGAGGEVMKVAGTL